MVHLYVGDMSMFAEVTSVYRKYFGINPPARYVVEILFFVSIILEILVQYGYHDQYQ
jgi:hypothetical protein